MATARRAVLSGTPQGYRRPIRPRTVGIAVVFLIALGLTAAPFEAGRASAAVPAASTRAPNSADRMVFWSGCEDLIEMTGAQLATWHQRGVDGFACIIGNLHGLGGAHRFTGDLSALSDKAYDLERYLRVSKIIPRAHRLGMKMYLGFYVSNAENGQTPLGEWFDDTSWTHTVLPEIRNVAAAATALGFDGLSFDQELYKQNDGTKTASWSWDYPGNTHTEAEVRAQVKARGAEMMQTILSAFPKVKILAYDSLFPDTWDELVQQEVNKIDEANRNLVFINLWDGLTSVSGYSSIQFINAVFFKTFHIGDSWDNAYTYEYNRLFAMFSQRLSNWAEAADRISESPFVWISNGSTDFEQARSPEQVAGQLAAARQWGMDRSFTNYTFDNLRTFDYGPYLDAMRAASKPGTVDDVPPRLLVDQPAASASKDISLTGTATDNQAIRVVRWKTEDGHTGAATMEWESRGDPASGYSWQMNWKADGVPLHSGVNRIEVSAEDIKGLFSIQTITVTP